MVRGGRARLPAAASPCFLEAIAHDDRIRLAVVTSQPRETLVLTLPADPELTRLTGIASTHFFQQNGLSAAAARRGARAVEKRCRRILRAAARKALGGSAALVLVLRPQRGILEVVGRAPGGPVTCLVRLTRPDPA